MLSVRGKIYARGGNYATQIFSPAFKQTYPSAS